MAREIGGGIVDAGRIQPVMVHLHIVDIGTVAFRLERFLEEILRGALGVANGPIVVRNGRRGEDPPR